MIEGPIFTPGEVNYKEKTKMKIWEIRPRLKWSAGSCQFILIYSCEMCYLEKIVYQFVTERLST